ncbi:hypothetical protein T11_3872 [Trichinella zimbabwensis]|uniref:Uncharacterized protein n=1 Tax=Trichinella zimbabwensis TaxID=268475 RepID=A0A0V1GSQ6_9BILA|nr:hypothetical protein T11_15293 [Trichinella zimbabwensis]KRZ01177.1 hypothetical protein T11_3872 [Trichinella zimbabwensis]
MPERSYIKAFHDLDITTAETFNADSLRRTQLAKAGNPSDGVTLARVKKLQHETATMVQILEHLRTVSKSTGQLWSDEFQLLPLQELNVRCSTDFGLPFLPSEDYWNVNNITNNLFDNVSEEVDKILQSSGLEMLKHVLNKWPPNVSYRLS